MPSERLEVRATRSVNSPLFQFAGKRAPMHAKPTRCLRDVEIRFRKRSMDQLPLQCLEARLPVSQGDAGIPLLVESRLDVIGVRRLGEIMAGAELDRLNSRADTGITRQHNDQRF